MRRAVSVRKALAIAGGAAALAWGSAGGEPAPIQFQSPKFLFEHHATDRDTGFQACIDGQPWDALEVQGPDGEPLLRVETAGAARGWGLTELFFETNEPPNEKVPIEEVQARFPAGVYRFSGRSTSGRAMQATTTLSHDIPSGPVLVSPAEGAVVDPKRVVIEWQPVETSLSGGPVDIVGYQVVVGRETETPIQGFSHPVFDVRLPPDRTRVTVSPEFFEPGTPYEFEVLALERSGNQTISSRAFETRE